MSRVKTGLDYFSFDIDFFEDQKVEFISAKYKELGELILIKLLCRIYRNGYFLPFGEDECLMFAKKAGEIITFELVNEVIQEAMKRGFFSKQHYDKYKILTSSGIQKRFLEGTSRRKEVNIYKEYWINYQYDNSIAYNVNIIPLNVNKIIDSTPKVKESKVKESKVKESKVLFANKQKMFTELQNYAEKYGNDIIKQFFDYWTEPNKSNSKMRFELERTWDLKRRLEYWSRNDRSWNHVNKNPAVPQVTFNYKAAEKYLEQLLDQGFNREQILTRFEGEAKIYVESKLKEKGFT